MLPRRHFLAASAAAVHAQPKPVVSIGGAADFHFGNEWDKPFVYPIRTVSGRVLSRRYPVEKTPGEETDHAWHRGLWYGHGIVNGQDFWREQGRDKTSRFAIIGEPAVKPDGIAARLSMLTPSGARIGTLLQTFTASVRGPFRFLDANLQIAADQGTALTFGDTDDGGFAFRLDDRFREDRGARLRNSEDLEGTANIWGKPARWVDYSAAIDGGPAGVAIFDHPANLRHPTQWHARGYGLCAANPFASRSFSKNKGPDGAHTLPSGGVLSLRYRVLIHEGVCEPQHIEKMYRQWAAG